MPQLESWGQSRRVSHDTTPLEQRGLRVLLKSPTVAAWQYLNPDLHINNFHSLAMNFNQRAAAGNEAGEEIRLDVYLIWFLSNGARTGINKRCDLRKIPRRMEKGQGYQVSAKDSDVISRAFKPSTGTRLILLIKKNPKTLVYIIWDAALDSAKRPKSLQEILQAYPS
ncbi:hypothetical protein QTP86_011672 [Hemibagrus guttatus]|nr:hypothetical protein QTP86_011672 [Hemibagrus guttatus]